MVCFCKNTAAQLPSLLAALDVSAELDVSLNASLQAMGNLAFSLGQFSLPDPAWLSLRLPSLSLSASAVATISAAASLQAQVMAALGLNLAIPAQAAAFARLTATLSARLSAMADLNLSLGFSVWPRLSATLSAVAQIEAALTAGLFASFPSMPTFPDLSNWASFFAQIQLLLPMISLSAQLGLNMSANFVADLSVALSAIINIAMPVVPVPALSLMASLSASLSAVASLTAALGVNPLQVGLPTIQAMISARISALAQLTMSTLGISLSALLALLPGLQLALSVNPPSFATSATVSAVMALNAEALASLNWSVPMAASLPVLTVGLPSVSLAAQLNAAFGLSASLSPCGAICDAGALLGAIASL